MTARPNTPRQDFASDNTAGAAPEALQALIDANTGAAASYGDDEYCVRAADLIRGFLDADAAVRFVASGTAANAVCHAALCRPFEAVLAHEHAHIVTSETGAPAFFGHGLGLIGLPGASGRIDPAALAAALAEPDSAHHPAPACLSLTNTTEYGALYDNAALSRLTGMAKAGPHPLSVHLDGARAANAAAAGFDMTALKSSGVDLFVMGGTKAGMSPTEAIVIFDKALTRRFDARLKQAGQLPSKSRFYAAPWIGMLQSGGYVRHAAHAGAMARMLAALSPFETAHPVESNAVFLRMTPEQLARINAVGWSVHGVADGSARLMCSWATTEALVEEMAAALKAVA
jgi:threonine aldolase